MILRSCRVLFSIAFHAEVLGVLVAVLPVGVFAASTMTMGDGFTKNHPLTLLHPSQRKRVKLSWVKIAMKVTARLQETRNANLS